MSKFVSLLAVPLMLLLLAGCAEQKKEARWQMKTEDGKVCGYCAESKMITGLEGTVHCAKCGKDMPAGKWCSKCNRFMLEGKAKCAGCGKMMPKGKYCSECKMYAGVPNMGYCEKSNKPCPRTEGQECPDKK